MKVSSILRSLFFRREKRDKLYSRDVFFRNYGKANVDYHVVFLFELENSDNVWLPRVVGRGFTVDLDFAEIYTTFEDKGRNANKLFLNSTFPQAVKLYNKLRVCHLYI